MARKTPTIRNLRNRLDTAFNRHIRERDGNCILCGAMDSLQCSHYYGKKARPILRWDEMNAHAMCASCHFKHHHGAEGDYALYMFTKYGIKAMEKLKIKSLESYEFTRDEYDTLIMTYTKN